MTLEKLLQDGRIHPARIEETYYQAKSELETHIAEARRGGGLRGRRPGPRPRARRGCSAGCVPHQLRPERARPLGRVRAARGDDGRTSSARAPKTARRAALLHDIGKAVSHEIEGPHALVGGDLARRHGEPEAVAHAMEAHHNEVEPQTVEAVIVQAADALSGARPGRARRVARALRQAPARARAASPPATTASTRSTRCRPGARSA